MTVDPTLRCPESLPHTSVERDLRLLVAVGRLASPMFGLGKHEDGLGGREMLDLTERMAASAPLRAVLVVSVAEQRQTTAEPMPSVQAFRSLVEGSLDEGAGSALAGLRRVATDVPCYRVRLGSDRVAVVDAVRSVAR